MQIGVIQLVDPGLGMVEMGDAANALIDETFEKSDFSSLVAGPGDVPQNVSYLQLAAGSKHGWGGPVIQHSSYETLFYDEAHEETAARPPSVVSEETAALLPSVVPGFVAAPRHPLNALVVPRLVAPANNSTVLLVSAVPSKVGVLSFVSLSVLD